MIQNIRHPAILALARRKGRVTVEGLATRFGVSLQTIRRDLSELAETGQLDRVHGGAVLPSSTVNIGYHDRREINAAAKDAIAGACAAMIPHDCSIFLNIGTTTEAVARHLLGHRNILAVTNNMNVASILTRNPDCNIIVTGGGLRRSDGGLTGELASRTIRGFKFDFAIIGCSALDQDGDILDFDLHEVGVSRSILEQSRKVYLVADHSKFHRKAPVLIASLADLDAFFTDEPLPGDLAQKCREQGVLLDIARNEDEAPIDDAALMR